jgi:hypothetical protein
MISSSTASAEGEIMESPNVETHRAGHEAFNQRDFVAMTKQYGSGSREKAGNKEARP